MPRRSLMLPLLLGLTLPTPSGAQAPDRIQQIAAAVLPLPAEFRSGAAVVAIDSAGRPHEWRAGANGLVCLADPPGDSTFDVRCYQGSFVPLIYRIRQLSARGMTDSALDRTIEADIRSGALKITREPTAGYRMYGPITGYDPVRNAVGGTIDSWQSVHVPFRTAESIGLSTVEEGIQPYVMASGPFWAHVMIMQRPLRY